MRQVAQLATSDCLDILCPKRCISSSLRRMFPCDPQQAELLRVQLSLLHWLDHVCHQAKEKVISHSFKLDWRTCLLFTLLS